MPTNSVLPPPHLTPEFCVPAPSIQTERPDLVYFVYSEMGDKPLIIGSVVFDGCYFRMQWEDQTLPLWGSDYLSPNMQGIEDIVRGLIDLYVEQTPSK